MHVSQMLDTGPGPTILANEALIPCIEACFDCVQSCSACAAACLGESDVTALARCIRINLDCADVCSATGRILSRQQHADGRVIRAQLEACLAACHVCGDECAMHAKNHAHCRICAEACRACARACQAAITALGPVNSPSVRH